MGKVGKNGNSAVCEHGLRDPYDRSEAETTENRDGKKAFNAWISVLVGVAAGFINGMFGGGGGLIVVPCFIRFMKYETPKAHATALAVVLPLSLVSGILYAAFGSIVWRSAIPVTAGVTAGGVFGAVLLKKLSSTPITVIFSVVMALAGVKMLFF